MTAISCHLKSLGQESTEGSCYLPEKGVHMLGEKIINLSQIILPLMFTFNSFCTPFPPQKKEIVRDLIYSNSTGSSNPKFWSANCSGSLVYPAKGNPRCRWDQRKF